MTGFLVGAALLVVVALLLLLRPVRTQTAVLTHRQLNASIYRDQMAELDRDLAGGELLERDYAQAQQELQRRVIEDSGDEAPVSSASAGKTSLILAALVPLLACAIYLLVGSPAGINPPPPEKRFSQDEIVKMVEGFAAKLEKDPGNLKGWAMLARSYKALGRLPEADKAYQRLGAAMEQDAQLLADYADLLVMMSGKFEGKPLQLLDKALKIDPDNIQALWLAGTAAFDKGNFKRAVAHWERAVRQMPPDSDEARMLGEGIAEAKHKAGSGKAPPN